MSYSVIELPSHQKFTAGPRSVRILYEDDQFLALDKPPGLPSQPLPQEPNALTMVTFAFQHSAEVVAAGIHAIEGGLLHRLDLGTSGVLLFAKNIATFTRARELWKTSSVTKVYRAVVSSPFNPSELPTLIDVPLGHSTKSSKRMLPISTEHDLKKIRGKALPARTWIERLHPYSEIPNLYSDLEVRIETGVMHQIRSHLKYVGSPILGDDRYAGPPHSRLMLHAWKLKLSGLSPQPIEICSPLPW